MKLQPRKTRTGRCRTFLALSVFLLAGWQVMATEEKDIMDEPAFFAALDLGRPELAAVREAVEDGNWPAAKTAWAKHLEERKSPTWIWSHRDRKEIEAFLTSNGYNWKRTIQSADRVLRREFNWEQQKKTLPRDIDWAKHYGKEWGNVLNRHGFWKDLGLAWWKTGDEKYAEDWVFMLRDWIKENPPKKADSGPWRSLEVGARATVWFDVMNLFMDAPAFDAETKYLFTRCLFGHAQLLAKVGWRDGNWGQTHATGLACVGIMFPEFTQAAAWRKTAFSQLSKHMSVSVFPDGAHCELTPGYHYWMTIFFMDTQRLARQNGYEIPDLNERHEKMFEFLMQVAKPDRWNVPLGDNGSGKNIEMIMGLGALLYNRPDMRYLAIDTVDPDWIWKFSADELAKYQNLPKQEPALRSHMMPSAKYGVMRTGWEKNDRFLLFDCAPWGGGHSHADRLQVVLYSGRDLLVDSGQTGYGNKLSESYFRKSKAHNVLLIDEQEQPGSNPEVLSWNVEDRVEFASGCIKSKEGLSHQRSVLFVKPDYWVVVDHVTGEGEHTLTRLFHLPDVAVEHDQQTLRTGYKDGDNLWIGAADESTIEMRKGWWRKSHHETPETPVAAFVGKQSLPAALCTVLAPFGNPDEIPTIERLASADPDHVALRVAFKDGRADDIVIAAKPADLSVGDHKGSGIALRVRQNKDKTTTTDLIQGKKEAE